MGSKWKMSVNYTVRLIILNSGMWKIVSTILVCLH
jgi:hypothetical protein